MRAPTHAPSADRSLTILVSGLAVWLRLFVCDLVRRCCMSRRGARLRLVRSRACRAQLLIVRWLAIGWMSRTLRSRLLCRGLSRMRSRGFGNWRDVVRIVRMSGCVRYCCLIRRRFLRSLRRGLMGGSTLGSWHRPCWRCGVVNFGASRCRPSGCRRGICCCSSTLNGPAGVRVHLVG
jgi:hypothetical protein